MKSNVWKDPPWDYVERQVGCLNAPPNYLAYACPLHYQGFDVQQMVDNPFEKQAGIDFRYEDCRQFPFGSTTLASTASSAMRPEMPRAMLVRDDCFLMPEYPPERNGG